jgi:hypothetical protein
MTGPPSVLMRGMRRLAAEPYRLYTEYWLRPRGSFVVSYPKSGRTWLRLMLASVLAAVTGRPLTLDTHSYGSARGAIPRIFFTHDGAGLAKPGPVPSRKESYRGKTVLLLVRDPRDVLVSHYYQASRRSRRGRAVGDLDTFVRGPLGVSRVIAFMNGWAAAQPVPDRFAIVRYEDLHLNCLGELRRCVEFFRIPDVDEDMLTTAVEAGTFERMRALESSGALDQRMQPRDPGDPDSYKVRSGRVGGYAQVLTAEQVAYLDAQIRQTLAPLFWYYVRP